MEKEQVCCPGPSFVCVKRTWKWHEGRTYCGSCFATCLGQVKKGPGEDRVLEKGKCACTLPTIWSFVPKPLHCGCAESPTDKSDCCDCSNHKRSDAAICDYCSHFLRLCWRCKSDSTWMRMQPKCAVLFELLASIPDIRQRFEQRQLDREELRNCLFSRKFIDPYQVNVTVEQLLACMNSNSDEALNAWTEPEKKRD